nr:hypothetical protein [Angustibacter aerolatus]
MTRAGGDHADPFAGSYRCPRRQPLRQRFEPGLQARRRAHHQHPRPATTPENATTPAAGDRTT